MTIKELEIIGFKSFALKTRLEFHDQITAVVGPNGCGKSNILDALKWVLGEKSVKSMRGDKMEDVIFSGTEHKKPSGYAQVDLTFDNSSKMLPLETESVKISRKLFRDGQSQYFINESRVPRKEIENLFFDTGLGKASYSFMQQGQMDMILSSKPEDRRLIFDEAAGISRFKAQQEESEKKLENTEVNITRLRDILSELERELNIKSNQSQKTEIYNQLEQKRNEHEQRVQFASLRDIEQNLEKLNERLEKKIHEREKSRQKLLQLEETLYTLEGDKEEHRRKLHEKDVSNQLNSEKVVQWGNQIEANKERKASLNEELETLKNRIGQVNERIAELKKQQHSQKQLSLELDNRMEVAEKIIKEIEQQTVETQKLTGEKIAKLHSNRELLEESRKALKELRSEQELIIKDLLDFLAREKEKWQNYLGEIDTQSNLFHEQFQKLEKLLGDLKKGPSDALFAEIEKNFNAKEWSSRLNMLGKAQHEFWNDLFEKGGIHSRKEEMEGKIREAELSIDKTEKENTLLQKQIEELKEKQASLAEKRESTFGDIKSFEVQKSNVTEHEKSIGEQIGHEETQLQYFKSKYSELESEILALQKKESDMLKEIDSIRKSMEKELGQIEQIKQAIIKVDQKREDIHRQIKKETEKSQEVFEYTNDLEVKIGTLLGAKEAMIQDLYNDFNITPDELSEKFARKKIVIADEKSALSEIKKEISELGPINPLAIEELNTVKSLYDHNQEQLEDITKAKKDILEVIEKIRQRSEEIFVECFEQIKENFAATFSKLFKGGEVDLRLTDPEKPLESGIDIQVQPPGKRARSLKLLSGGEKALTAISLMFGIYMVRSSPLCVLDEIDAPLDDQNVGRFLTLLEDFRDKTQFVLITHNKKTMTHADSMVGVTMQEPGVSTLLSVEVKASS